MALTLTILRPFLEEKKEIDWIQLACPGGSFVVGPGHRPLVNILSGKSTLTYTVKGHEETLAVSEDGGLVHVLDDTVVLFLN